MGVCGSGSCCCTLLVVPIYMCGFFFLWRRSCVSSPPAGGGIGSYGASFGVSAQHFLGHLRFSAMCHAAGYPSGVPHLADSGWLTSSCRCRLELLLVCTAIQPSHGLVLILRPGFLFSGLVERGAFHRVPSPLSSFGMWSPFGVISVSCHY